MNEIEKTEPEKYKKIKDFEEKCDINYVNPYETDKPNKINFHAANCGLDYIFNIYNELPVIDEDKTVIIVDVMNIFQNVSVLIYALCVIDFSVDELNTIYKMLDYNQERKPDFFQKKIEIFDKIMTRFYVENSIVFFVVQGNNEDKEKTELIPYNKINSKLIRIATHCYNQYCDGSVVIKQCAQDNIKNESDDVCSLFLYNKYLKDFRDSGKKVIFWTYDNYEWFTGEKDTSNLIKLDFSILEENKFKFTVRSFEEILKIEHSQAEQHKFKNEDVLHQIIVINNQPTWRYIIAQCKYYYQIICEIINKKLNKSDPKTNERQLKAKKLLINNIISFYQQYNQNYIIKSSLNNEECKKISSAIPSSAKPSSPKSSSAKPSSAKLSRPKSPSAKPPSPKPPSAKPPSAKPSSPKPPSARPLSDRPLSDEPSSPKLPSDKPLNATAKEFIPSRSPSPTNKKYFNKYLKYKQKYLTLKNKLENN
jgi:hypothetical protein